MRSEPEPVQRVRLEARGRVQGVGFRPCIYRLAQRLGLGGCVGNDAQGAFIELEGPPALIEEFCRLLPDELPPLARLSGLLQLAQDLQGESAFHIVASADAGPPVAEVAPDVATCPDCRRELLDPADRRFRYPFINCTNCGPRYAIAQGLPYDRATTTMAAFAMCPECQLEYDDPANRRFHAQPNACPVCGPRVWLADAAGRELPGDALAQAAARLQAGQILAIKGLGGFHLACRADLDPAVLTLRERKGREAKPFAVMVPNLEAAAALAEIPAAARAALASWQAPIVLLPRRSGAALSPHVAPACDSLGLMLPYTPLHHLLFAAGLGPLVMTSANPSDEPLCADNAEALARLGQLADAFLLHNRDIARRLDDSVLACLDAATLVTVRRARGYVPAPLALHQPAPRPILALGGDLKSVAALAHGHTVVLSEHLGDLGNPAAYRHFVDAIDRLRQLLRVEPQVVALDLHPGYHSARFGRRLGLPVVAVQHHHAHVAAVLAEHGLDGRVVGLAADGTGYGTDGRIWGCELLVADLAGFVRRAHLRYFPLPGGDLAAREPWRPGLALLREACGDDWRRYLPGCAPGIEPARLEELDRHLRAQPRQPLTSSLGRLFDAAAFVLGLAARNRFEAEAAMAIEAAAGSAGDDTGPTLPWASAETAAGVVEWDPRPLILALAEGRAAGRPVPDLALAFHRTLADMLAHALETVALDEGLDRVVLAGGCFLNRRLGQLLTARLRELGLRVYLNRLVPPGDGGIALGQAAIAAANMRRGER